MLPYLARSIFRNVQARPQFAQIPTRSMFIQTRSTPNAHATMFLPGREVLPGGTGNLDFPTPSSASSSPLARKLFHVTGVKGVFFGGDFVTVTKDDTADWAVVRPEVFEVLMDFFSDDQLPILDDTGTWESDTAIHEDDSEVVVMIKELLETRVKPFVAADGGSIVYRGFEDGIVKLEMQGACSTCSSSAITLKNGVENMLRHYVPEVTEVQQVVGEHGAVVNLDQVSNEMLAATERQIKEQQKQREQNPDKES